MAAMFASPIWANGGIPSEVPSCRILASSASERVIRLSVVATATALSPPFASAPWQPEQFAVYCRAPRSPPSGCAQAAERIPAIDKRRRGASGLGARRPVIVLKRSPIRSGTSQWRKEIVAAKETRSRVHESNVQKEECKGHPSGALPV